MVLKLLHSDLDPITEIPNSIEDFLQKYIKKSQSDTFTSQSKRSIKEGMSFLTFHCILCLTFPVCNSYSLISDVIYVGQREVAILNPHQNFGLQYIGSEDATTCHIITMRNPQSGKCALAHLDQVPTKGLDHIAHKLQDKSSPEAAEIEFHIFGGYQDERDISEELSLSLLSYLIKSQFKFKLGYCVTGSHNTFYGAESEKSKYPRPRLYGIGIDVLSNEIFPADFPDHSPDPDLRHVRLSFRQYDNYDHYYQVKDYLYEDWNSETGAFVIEPFDFHQSPDLTWISKAPDGFLLKNMSTSPKVEPQDFCAGMRRATQMVLDHPEPLKTVFRNNKAKTFIYSENEKKWILCVNK